MKEADTEDVVMWLAGGFFLILYGPLVLARFMPQVAAFLVHWGVLATSGVLLPLVGGAGLDLGRLLLAAGILTALVLIAALSAGRALRSRGKRGRA